MGSTNNFPIESNDLKIKRKDCFAELLFYVLIANMCHIVVK